MARFDLERLKALAGEKTFERGLDYAREDRVEFTIVADETFMALVEGSDIYSVAVSGHGDEISGACSCAAFEETGLCRHMVALAVTINELGEAALGELANRTAALQDHLQRQDHDTLVAMLLSRAAGDPALLQQLLIEAGLEEDDGDWDEAPNSARWDS